MTRDELLAALRAQADLFRAEQVVLPDQKRLEEPRIYDGVERCLERMSETVARFIREDVVSSEFAPSAPWREGPAFGNVVRHEYDNLDERSVRDTILPTLPELRAAAVRLKARFEAEAFS